MFLSKQRNVVMKSGLCSKFQVVVEYVKNLVPTYKNNFYVQPSNNPEKDAKSLVYLTLGSSFFTVARNNREYFYCFVNSENDTDVIRYILRSNGMTPRLHKSRFYNRRDKVLRVPVSSIKNNKIAWDFTSLVDKVRKKPVRYDEVSEYIQGLREKVK